MFHRQKNENDSDTESKAKKEEGKEQSEAEKRDQLSSQTDQAGSNAAPDLSIPPATAKGFNQSRMGIHVAPQEQQKVKQQQPDATDTPYEGGSTQELQEGAGNSVREQEVSQDETQSRSVFTGFNRLKPVQKQEAATKENVNLSPHEKEDITAMNQQTSEQAGFHQNQSQQAQSETVQGARSSVDTTVSEGRQLIVGRGISLTGEIQECNHLVVEGRVEAALKGSKKLDITENGTFIGSVEIEEATISGTFEGEITVNGRLTITETGAITGTISYKELEVQSGAKLDGKVSPIVDVNFKRSSVESEEKSKQAGQKPQPNVQKAKGKSVEGNDKSDKTSSESDAELPLSQDA